MSHVPIGSSSSIPRCLPHPSATVLLMSHPQPRLSTAAHLLCRLQIRVSLPSLRAARLTRPSEESHHEITASRRGRDGESHAESMLISASETIGSAGRTGGNDPWVAVTPQPHSVIANLTRGPDRSSLESI